jgi:hypothetical protein
MGPGPNTVKLAAIYSLAEDCSPMSVSGVLRNVCRTSNPANSVVTRATEDHVRTESSGLFAPFAPRRFCQVPTKNAPGIIALRHFQQGRLWEPPFVTGSDELDFDKAILAAR